MMTCGHQGTVPMLGSIVEFSATDSSSFQLLEEKIIILSFITFMKDS